MHCLRSDLDFSRSQFLGDSEEFETYGMSTMFEHIERTHLKDKLKWN
jgi:hypothetical protein